MASGAGEVMTTRVFFCHLDGREWLVSDAIVGRGEFQLVRLGCAEAAFRVFDAVASGIARRERRIYAFLNSEERAVSDASLTRQFLAAHPFVAREG